MVVLKVSEAWVYQDIGIASTWLYENCVSGYSWNNLGNYLHTQVIFINERDATAFALRFECERVK